MVVELFVSVCMLAAHQCVPEIVMPVVFLDMDTCSLYVQSVMDAAHDEDHGAVLGDIGLTFRCASRT